MKANAVFEGGGMRGIGIVGALKYMESQGYTWEKAAGTSVGSVIAACVVSGYTAKEIGKIITETDFTKFQDKNFVQRFPVVGKAFGLFKEKGLYSGDYIEEWMGSILKAKGVSKFKDVSVDGKSRLKMIASDITNRTMMVLPDDLDKYGIDPMEFEIAKAVRMSSSIPFFFKPVMLSCKDGVSYVVDGSITCNFPIGIFDTGSIPDIPTIGFKFDSPKISNTAAGKTDPVSILYDIAGTMSNEIHTEYEKEENVSRTILIPTAGVETTEFNIDREKGTQLYKAGYKSAESFLSTWDFYMYINKYYLSDILA